MDKGSAFSGVFYIIILRLTGPSFNSAVYAVTARFKDELSKEKENLEAEETRLMYVAATHAGCVLLIPKTSTSNLWASLHTLGTQEIDSILYGPDVGQPIPQELNPEQDPCEWEAMIRENPLIHRNVETKTWQLHLPSNLHDSDKESEKTQEPDAEALLPRGQTSSLLLGTIVHRAMEMLVSSEAKLKDSAIISATEV